MVLKTNQSFGNNIDANYSRNKVAEFEKNNPEFKKWAKDVYDYLKADKKELVNNGVISQELSDRFEEMYPHYVPIQRVDTRGQVINVPLDTKRTGINTPIKKAKGGSSDISPLFETIANRTEQTYRASARNSLGLELRNTLAKLNELNSTDENIDLDAVMETISTDNNEDLLQKGKNGQNPTFTVFDNGQKVTFDINEDIYDALKPKDSSALLSQTFVPAQKISNLRRGVLTEYNPVFLVTNSIKDAQDVLFNSQHPAKTYSKFPEAYAQIIGKGYWYQEYLQNGGEQNSYFKEGQFEKETSKFPKAKNAVTLPLRAISSANNVIEMAPRLAEYIASREKGRSVQTSMLDASRVTTNFKAGGDFTRFLNRNGATFLNAGVQGAVQQVRNIREANAQGLKGWTSLALRTIVAGAPALLLNNLLWKDDDDYEELQDYVKDKYYIIGKIGDNKFLRIPKGRTVSAVQKIVSDIDKYINNKQELNIDEVTKDFWEDLKFGVEQSAPNNPVTNNIFSPIIQAVTNKSWYGEDIVPSRLQNVPSAEQYDESTDKLSKFIGEKLNISPKKINYVLDQYSGGVGDIALPKLTPQAENNVVEDKFTTDSVMKSRYPGEFFEKVDELKVASNSIKASDKDKLQYKYMSKIDTDISDLYKKKKEIQASSDSDESKKSQLKEVQKEINKMSKDSLTDVNKIQVSGNSATVGDKEYYKDTKGEWQLVKDKPEGLNLSSYSNFKNQIKEATEKKKQETGKETATLNDSESISVLQKGNYSKKDKDLIYRDIINKEDDVYDSLKLLDGNSLACVDAYFDYKTSDFSNDRKDDGTAKGKSITKSGQKKLQNFLNNSNLTYMQKLYLTGVNNSSLNSTERHKLKNYIDSLNITDSQKKTMQSKLKFTTEMKDGSISWKY